ncbi:MAG: N-acetylmuramoyl-L-alanine amidase, partial [Flavobacteriaceae bacterium]|nr:N-acetylmuramoyl-L-alanine amidase [Flavobacteriaceae bacterium]
LEKNKRFKVIYTRKTDTFIELIDRAAIANKADANLFVSVHCDSHSSSAYGAGTFVLGLHATKRNLELAKKENSVIYLEENYEEKYEGFDPNKPESLIGIEIMAEEYLDQSILLADLIQKNFTNKLKRKDRSVKQAGFWVLHNTYMPSVLVETGFLTNKIEGAYLNSKKGQDQMATAITEAIVNYEQRLASNTVTSETPDVTKVNENNSDIAVDNNATEKEETSDVVFKIQISASSRKLPLKAYNFKGLKDISVAKNGNLYRYFYSETSNYEKAKKFKAEAMEHGYNSAFVVAFKNGEKVPLSTVLKSNSN